MCKAPKTKDEVSIREEKTEWTNPVIGLIKCLYFSHVASGETDRKPPSKEMICCDENSQGSRFVFPAFSLKQEQVQEGISRCSAKVPSLSQVERVCEREGASCVTTHRNASRARREKTGCRIEGIETKAVRGGSSNPAFFSDSLSSY